MEVIPVLELFSSIIRNKKILLLEPNVDLHRQLNFSHTTDLVSITNESDMIENSNTHWDYVLTHAYATTSMPWYSFHLLEKYNITCDVLVVDESGEGVSIRNEVESTFVKNNLANHLKCKTIKWIAPFYDYSSLEKDFPNIEFFKSKMMSTRFFCNKMYHTIHHHKKEENGEVVFDEHNQYGNHVVAGLKWNPDLKEKLFMCLNNQKRDHRYLLIHYLKQYNIINDGYVSLLDYDGSDKIGMVKNNTFLTKKINVERMTIPWESNLSTDEGNSERFGIQTEISQKTYIDVVTESSSGYWPFKTEKCVKPFYNLQFPIIYGHIGIVQDLREAGFDMFDDIINHSYDDPSDDKHFFEWTTDNVWHEETAFIDNIRIPRLVEEVCRLSNLDIPKLYKENKHRFIKNQEVLYDLTIKNNNILQEIGEFIFGSDIEFYEVDRNKMKKIYLGNG